MELTTSKALIARGAAAIAVAAIGALAACSAVGGPVDIDPKTLPTPSAVTDLHLPVQAYQWSEADRRAFQQAQHLLIKKCTARFGVQYTSPPPPPGEGGGDSLNFFGRYGRYDRAHAAAHGFETPQTTEAILNTPEGGYWNPSPLEEQIVRGWPRSNTIKDSDGKPLDKDGCGGEAAKSMGGDGAWRRSVEEIDRLERDTWQRARHDALVRDAGKKWVACMSTEGYDYKDQWEINETAPPPGETKQAEIKRAVADVDCRHEANLVGIWNAVEAELQRQEIESDPEKFADIKNRKDDSIRAAQDILTGRR